MRLEYLRLHNVGPFRDFEVDLTALPGPLVAVTGPNGAGKSTMLELAMPGACYRSTPTRGSLLDLATARDSLVESRLANGSTWTLRHLLDRVSSKSEALVLNANGEAQLPDTKVRSMDAWVSRHLPPAEVLFATVFQPQGAAGFLAAKPSERKSLLLRILGIERLEDLAARAREHAREARAALDVCLARLADHQARVVPDARSAAEAARRGGDPAADLVECTKADLDAAQQRVRDLEQLRATNKQRSTLWSVAKEAAEAVRLRVQDLRFRIANNRAVLADSDEIRAAQAKAEALTQEIAEAEAKATAAAAEVKRCEAELAAVQRQEQEANAEASRAGVRVNQLTERLRDADLVGQAQEAIVDLLAAMSQAAERRHLAHEALEALRATRLAGAEERIGDLRTGLRMVIDSSPAQFDPRKIAKVTLSADDAALATAAEYPQRLAKAEQELRDGDLAEVTARRDLQTQERLAARAPEIAAARADLAVATRERDAAQERALELHRHGWDNAMPALKDAQNSETEATAQARALRDALGDLHPLLKRGEPLANAQARLQELEPQLAAATAELERAEAAVDDVPPTLQEPPGCDDFAAQLRAATERHAIAVREHRELHERIAVLEERERQSREAECQVSELEAQRALLETDLADWNRLAQDLGRDGVQAAEIDAAGPELTELTNDLLHSCHGPRFTVRVETQRLSADGKRMLEGCDVVVLDTVRGREAQGETFSGGERVIIGEALSLALTMLACRRAGLDRPTLVRDESGAALDPANARVYVAMLRHAARHLNADKVLFVSHSPEVVEMADARIEVQP